MSHDLFVKQLKSLHEDLRSIKGFFKATSKLTCDYYKNIEKEFKKVKLSNYFTKASVAYFEFKKNIELRLNEYEALSYELSNSHERLKSFGEKIKIYEAKVKMGEIVFESLSNNQTDSKIINKEKEKILSFCDGIGNYCIDEMILFSKGFLQLNDYVNKERNYSTFEKNMRNLINKKQESPKVEPKEEINTKGKKTEESANPVSNDVKAAEIKSQSQSQHEKTLSKNKTKTDPSVINKLPDPNDFNNTDLLNSN